MVRMRWRGTALKAGKLNEAQAAIKDAIKLGTRDAKLLYHAGMIARFAGDKTSARDYLKRALALNPQVDPLQSIIARKSLRQLNPLSAGTCVLIRSFVRSIAHCFGKPSGVDAQKQARAYSALCLYNQLYARACVSARSKLFFERFTL